MIDATHDPALTSWVDGADDHADFPIQNLPFGVFAHRDCARRIGVAIGDFILDCHAAQSLFSADVQAALQVPALNALLALPIAERVAMRARLSAVLSDPQHRGAITSHLRRAADCTMHLPCAIGDYTDFYVGIHHATNIGKQFRPDNPLLPNYKYVPIGYHGRASSVRPTGTPVVRPNGQRKAPDADVPTYGPSRRLDYELELGIWIGEGNALGTPIPIADAARHIAGYCLLNDWSARDLQAWEYQPLGPFLAKNFLTTVSPWVVTAEALAPFRVAQPPRPAGDPAPLPYLTDAQDQASGALSLELTVAIASASMRDCGRAAHVLGRGVATNMYWTPAQLVAHHSANGCNLMPGDLMGTGTISTPDDSGLGSLMELSRGGTAPVAIADDERRAFLEDGDEIIMHARAVAPGRRTIGFGECRGIVAPARPV